jgi:hypothetical protein
MNWDGNELGRGGNELRWDRNELICDGTGMDLRETT